MYESKKSQGNRCQVFTRRMSDSREKRLVLETSLHKAIKEEQFALHYQPLVDLRSGEIRGLEALIRWPQPDGSMISPGEFLPVAYETGLILSIGQWVIEEACRQLRDWLDRGLDISVAVNVNEKQLAQTDFISDLMAMLERFRIPAHHFVVELTEEAMLSDPSIIEKQIRALHKHDVDVSIDDFGTGYSSLNRLNNIPLSILKIDRSFVNDITKPSSSARIVRTVAQLAENLSLKTVAEGIETETQLNFLQELGCDLGQGYYLHRPQSSRDITSLLNRDYNSAA